MQGRVARRLSKIESLSRDDVAAGRLEANPKGRLSLRLMRRCSSSETLFIESPRRRALPGPQIQAAQTLRIEWERSKWMWQWIRSDRDVTTARKRRER